MPRTTSVLAVAYVLAALCGCAPASAPRAPAPPLVRALAATSAAPATAPPAPTAEADPTASAAPTATPSPGPTSTPAPTGPIVALGDSLTFGYGVTLQADGPPPAHSYPWDMARDLGIPVVNAGVNGTTAHEVLDPASETKFRPVALRLPALLALHPRLMVVGFGTNEAYRGWPMARATADLDQLLGRIAAAGVSIVVVGTHIDCTLLPACATLPGLPLQTYTAAWDTALETLALRYHAGLVLAVEHGFAPADFFDSIHCTAQGYQLMADRIEVAVRAKLGLTAR